MADAANQDRSITVILLKLQNLEVSIFCFLTFYLFHRLVVNYCLTRINEVVIFIVVIFIFILIVKYVLVFLFLLILELKRFILLILNNYM